MIRFLRDRWFLIVLFLVLAVGIGGASRLQPISEFPWLRNSVVAAVLFVMALPLPAREMARAVARPGPPLLAVGVNFGLLPLTAWGVSLLLDADMAAGLWVAATTPCTLASASVWTRRAGGNDAVSILVTLITNASCFLITPLWLLAMTGRQLDSPELSLGNMAVKLGLLVVLPMAAAQLLRLVRPIAAAATARKRELSVLAQCGILTMVLFGAVRTGMRLSDESAAALTVSSVLAMLAAVVFVHLAMLGTGLQLARLLGFSRGDQIAVAFAGSQKTLMVGLLVAISLQVSILPMVAYHVGQLLIDTIIADRFLAQQPSK